MTAATRAEVALPDPEAVAAYLRRHGVIGEDEDAHVEPFGGGISSVVMRIRTSRDCMVYKHALPRLRVPEVWEMDQSRILGERDCMAALATLLPPGSVPEVRFSDPESFVLVMSCAPPGRIWKECLLAGDVSSAAARRVGTLAGQLQAGAAASEELRERFDDIGIMLQGRVDPFHRTVARAHPDLAPAIEEDVERLVSNRRTLVLGDLSPKNIFVYPDRALLLDLEVAHWGDPAFDPAFLLTHLLLKSVHVRGRAEELLDAAAAFWDAYRARAPNDWSPGLERGVALELGCLLLARIDGKSRAEYLSEPERDQVRQLARGLVQRPSADPPGVLERTQALLRGRPQGS